MHRAAVGRVRDCPKTVVDWIRSGIYGRRTKATISQIDGTNDARNAGQQGGSVANEPAVPSQQSCERSLRNWLPPNSGLFALSNGYSHSGTFLPLLVLG
jgi:hypothetical protein